MLTDELLNYIFDSKPHLLTPSMSSWLVTSRRFTTFVENFRDKIRKKLRAPQDRESFLDLRLELETAYLLLQEKNLHVVYEAQGLREVRSPDFAVSYTTSLTFMVEVTRLRADGKTARSDEPSELTPSANSTPSTFAERLSDTICSKLGQLLAQHSNVLIVGVDSLQLAPADLQLAMSRVKQRAEANDPLFLRRHHLRNRVDFFNYYQRLSEVIIRIAPLQAGQPSIVWINPQARHPLSSKVRTALYHSQSVGATATSS
ncbi:MAG: hypothetical protein U0175_05310 [Caldilineaceae bacterium]